MFRIVTDNGSDIPAEYSEKHGIETLNLATIIDGVTYNHGVEISAEEFYRKLSEGAKPTTSQVNPAEAREYFEKKADNEKEILYIGISSGLSGTVGSVKIGADEVMEKYPDLKIEVVDTLTGSLGEVLVIDQAIKFREEGKSLEETAGILRDMVKNVCLGVTVDNLMDLWRGGRVSKSSAFLGTLASIKPFIIVDNEGKLEVVSKLRGRKKALEHLLDYMEDHMGSKRAMNEKFMAVGHGNCIEDAEYVKKRIEERFGFRNIMINNMGPVIGTHTGPTIVIVCFYGDSRE
ncbi:MAG: DegV family protein [Lachnospiraceae bacterium]|nr:DegV family protein [Lachnospiraceae bacterium]